jgi:hypothetical protein
MLTSGITIDQAIARGHDFWELRFTNWGYRGTVAYPVESFPATSRFSGTANDPYLPPITGVAIAPTSTVDRVIVRVNLGGAQGDLPNSATYPIWEDAILGYNEYVLSAKTPILSFLPSSNGELIPWGGTGTTPPGPIKTESLLFRADPSTEYGRYYYPETHPIENNWPVNDPSQGWPFGPSGTGSYSVGGPYSAFNDPTNDPYNWYTPELRVWLFLRKHPLAAPGRAPMTRSGRFTVSNALMPMNGNEMMIAWYPIMGRERVKVTFRPYYIGTSNLGAATLTYRIALMAFSYNGFGQVPPPPVDPYNDPVLRKTYETTVDAATVTVTPGQPVKNQQFSISHPQAQFLMLYVTPSWTPPQRSPQFEYIVEATD